MIYFDQINGIAMFFRIDYLSQLLLLSTFNFRKHASHYQARIAYRFDRKVQLKSWLTPQLSLG